MGRNLAEFTHPDELRLDGLERAEMLSGAREHCTREKQLLRPDGSTSSGRSWRRGSSATPTGRRSISSARQPTSPSTTCASSGCGTSLTTTR